MVERIDGITDYFEGFINYGYNKIQYVENLRHLGSTYFVV